VWVARTIAGVLCFGLGVMFAVVAFNEFVYPRYPIEMTFHETLFIIMPTFLAAFFCSPICYCVVRRSP
jgi:hypothetical protein